MWCEAPEADRCEVKAVVSFIDRMATSVGALDYVRHVVGVFGEEG